MKRHLSMLGDLLFYACTHALRENWLDVPGLDDQAFYEAHYGGSGVSRLAAVSNVMMWNANSTFGPKVGIYLMGQ